MSRSACWVACSFETSRNTSTAPTTWPVRSRIGAQLSAMGHSVPSRAISTVWLARPWVVPCCSVDSTGMAAGSRVSSLMMRKTSSMGWPIASARGPAGELLGLGVEQRHPGLRVGGDHRVADGVEGDRELLFADLQGGVGVLQCCAGLLLDLEGAPGHQVHLVLQPLRGLAVNEPREREGDEQRQQAGDDEGDVEPSHARLELGLARVPVGLHQPDEGAQLLRGWCPSGACRWGRARSPARRPCRCRDAARCCSARYFNFASISGATTSRRLRPGDPADSSGPGPSTEGGLGPRGITAGHGGVPRPVRGHRAERLRLQ